MSAQFNTVDCIVIVLYLVIIMGAGLWAGLRQRKSKSPVEGYFLASRNLKWPTIGLALFATNISCVHLVSLAQAGYDQGLLMGNFEWMAGFALILLSLAFAPLYIRSKIVTLPDFLERRYSRECRDGLAIISMLAAIIFHIAFPLVAGWVVLHGVFGIDKWTCIILVCILTAVYTVFGGLGAVVITETIQALVLLGGAILVTGFAWHKAGGWEGMTATLQASEEITKLSMLHSSSVDSQFPWYAILLGCPILGIWAWCADQTVVQRVLGAKDEDHARIGALFCAAIKILPVFIFILPGLLFLIIMRKNLLPNIEVHNSKEVYGLMIKTLVPHGLLGIMAAALMSSLMGTLASAANSTATLFSYDIWKRLYPNTPEQRLVGIGRIASLVAFICGIALVPLLDKYESIFSGATDIIAHLAPPITCIFITGIFWQAASARSAKWTLWLGFAGGALFYMLKILCQWQPNWKSWIPSLIYETPYLIMTFYLFVSCLLLQITLAFCFPKLPHEDPEKLFWNRPLDCIRIPGWPGIKNYRFLAALIALTIMSLYLFQQLIGLPER